ncbi:hypothetical protein F5Y11DRAFT_366148 [Daldinia sp. FL1419]|nr:hypothetical protein F5Y11DRAFT_366148 [Daldinia sp. FL1419]
MHRLKALLRRRSYDEVKTAPPESNTATLSHSRRSLESHRSPADIKEGRHVTSPKLPGRNINATGKKTYGNSHLDSHHGTSPNNHDVAQKEPSPSIETSTGRQRNVLVKHPRRSASRKGMPGHFYSDNKPLIEERPEPLLETQNSRRDRLIPSTAEQGLPVEIVDKEGNTFRSKEPVTHETIRPHVHEILEEQIHREIHNHDVYHRIQPVYEVEILPARHFIPGPDGGLIEVPEDSIPECTGMNQKWHVSKEPPRVASVPALRQPDVASENKVVNEPMESIRPTEADAEEERGLEQIGTHTTIDNREFKDVYFDSWQSSAARIF